MKDFWQMIWENKVGVICMLSKIYENEKAKADPYWPEGDEVSNFGTQFLEIFFFLMYFLGVFSVSLSSSEFSSSLIKRVLRLENTKANLIREIIHFQFTDWPDFGIIFLHSG